VRHVQADYRGLPLLFRVWPKIGLGSDESKDFSSYRFRVETIGSLDSFWHENGPAHVVKVKIERRLELLDFLILAVRAMDSDHNQPIGTVLYCDLLSCIESGDIKKVEYCVSRAVNQKHIDIHTPLRDLNQSLLARAEETKRPEIIRLLKRLEQTASKGIE
jgi:hypothetical protein